MRSLPHSPSQKRVLDFVRRFIDRNGYPPSYEEIADGCGWSSIGTVAEHVTALVRKGLLIKQGDNRKRCLLPTDRSRAIERLPDLLEALETIAGMDGDSMTDAGDAVDIARDALAPVKTGANEENPRRRSDGGH